MRTLNLLQTVPGQPRTSARQSSKNQSLYDGRSFSMAFNTRNTLKVAGFVLLLMVAVLGLSGNMSPPAGTTTPTGVKPTNLPLPAPIPPATVVMPAYPRISADLHD